MAGFSASISKLLSLIVCGRNDSYQGNFLYRLTTCINFAALQLERLGRLEDVELLVGDWASEIPLSQALPLTESARKICRFIYIPHEIARNSRPDGGFFPAGALNAGLRRAAGQYRVMYDADSLFPSYSFRALFALLDGKMSEFPDPSRGFFYLNRHHVPWEIVQSQPTIEEWEKYLLVHGGTLPVDASGFGLGSCGGGHLAHQSAWEKLRGYNESLTGAGWSDIELSLRAMQEYSFTDLAGIGVHLYHMEHWPRNRRSTDYSNSVQNRFVVSPDVSGNGEDWGLGKYSLEIQEPSSSPQSTFFARDGMKFPSHEEFQKASRSLEVKTCVKEYFEAVQSVRQLELAAGIQETVDFDLLYPVAWYALQYMPRTFYYYGSTLAHPIGILGKACCGAEIYTAYPWKESEQSVYSPLSRMASILRHVQFRGYVRHVSGDPATALERLVSSTIEPLKIQLAIVNDFISPEETAKELVNLVAYMDKMSMLILSCETAERLQQVMALTENALAEIRSIELADSGKKFFFKE